MGNDDIERIVRNETAINLDSRDLLGELATAKAENERLQKALELLAKKEYLKDKEGDLATMSNFQSGGLFIANHVAEIAAKALEGNLSGVYVPLAEVERLRRALEDVRREIEAAVNCGVLNQTGHNWMNYIDAIARKALEEERP
jgi:hypothetical protein